MFLQILSSAIFVFGPSCGGKSSLSQALAEKLGSTWAYLDRDVLLEQGLCAEEGADRALDEEIEHCRIRGISIIVDAQIPWRESRENEFFLLVYAPLPLLLERDAKRTEKLGRDPLRAHYARLYVEETYAALLEPNESPLFPFALSLNSSLLAIEEEVAQVLKCLPSAISTAPDQGIISRKVR